MRVLDAILNTIWAMEPEPLRLLIQIARREGPGPEAVALQMGKRLENTRKVEVRDGVAIIPVVGPVFRYANMFTEVSGATSLDAIARDLGEAARNEDVKAILLLMDTPGGDARGIAELAAHIAALRDVKPIHCYASGYCASAGYWLAAAADSLTIASTAIVGSIGVRGAYLRATGEEVEFVSSQSPRKRMDLDSDEGKAAIQQTLDDMAEVFVGDVARYRNVPRATVLADFGQGGVLVGRQAVKAGLADRLGTFEGTLRRLSTRPASLQRGPRAEADEEPLTLATREDYKAGAIMRTEARELLAITTTVLEPALAACSFEDQLTAALAAVAGCIERAEKVKAIRAGERRQPLGAKRRDQLAALAAKLTTLADATEPPAPVPAVVSLDALKLETLRRRTAGRGLAAGSHL